MHLQIFSTQSDFISASVSLITTLCSTKQGSLFIALSGGKTPQSVYEALAAASAVDFERIEWYLVDERYVPLDHTDSNYKMIMEAFGAVQPDFSEHFHYFDTTLTPDEAARRYVDELKKIPDQKLDIIFLGVGNDGHTASLFPNNQSLQDNENLSVATINESAPNFPVRERLTITWPMILTSHAVVVLVSGKEKGPIINEILHGIHDDLEIPAKRLQQHSQATIYYGDY